MTKKLLQEVDRLKDTENRNADRIDRLSENIISLTVNVATLSSNISGFTAKIDGAEKLWGVQLSQLSMAIQTAETKDKAMDQRLEDTRESFVKRIDDAESAILKKLDDYRDAMDVRVKYLESAYQEAKGSVRGATSIVMSGFSFAGFIIMAVLEFIHKQ